MPRRFFTLDVFADTPLAGNPLAVVIDAAGLDAGAMQRIAREFNLSETVFVLPPENRRHRARIRIFTPGLEMPFAGHPTVGTAVLLASLDHPDAIDGDEPTDILFGLEETIGIVPCAVTLGGGRAFARFELPKLPERDGEAKDDDRLARALGLEAADIGFDNHRPTVYSAGFPYSLVPVRDLAALGRIRIDTSVWKETFGQEGLGAAYAYTRETALPGSAFRARMFSPGDGIPEDPATGSAVAAFAGAVMAFEAPADGNHRLRIEQGFEMGRPSLIDLSLTVVDGRLIGAAISGAAVIVGEGVLRV